jgi:hypothetical protein
MYSDFIIRVSTQILAAMLGGMPVFCLYYAGWLPNGNIVRLLLCKALIWRGAATILVYCQGKYLG